jgi:hypothetical protein
MALHGSGIFVIEHLLQNAANSRFLENNFGLKR